MQIKIFTIPIIADEQDVEDLNHFLRSHKVIDVKRELTQDNGNSCWTFCIIYMQDSNQFALSSNERKREKIDYKEVLEPAVFERFAQMRKLRKEIAEREAVPAYAVFTDAELAEMAKKEQLSMGIIESISGIGKKRAEKYGSAFCEMVQTEKMNETEGTSD